MYTQLFFFFLTLPPLLNMCKVFRPSCDAKMYNYIIIYLFVLQVCAEQKERAAEMDEKYHILWSNIEQLLGCCDKFLQLTSPEVEALKLDTHQADASNKTQTFVSQSQVDGRDDHSQVVSVEAQSVVSETHSSGQVVTQHEDFSQIVESLASLTERDHDDNYIVSVGDGNQLGEDNEVHLEPITGEDEHERGTDADKQDLEFVEVQSVPKQAEIQIKHPLLNEIECDLNIHSTATSEVLHGSPTVLTQSGRSCKVTKNLTSPELDGNELTVTSQIQLEHDVSHTDTSVNFAEVHHLPFASGNEKCSSLSMSKDLQLAVIVPDGIVQASLSLPVASQSNPTFTNEEATPQVCNSVSSCSLISNFSQPHVSHVSNSLTSGTLSVSSQTETRAANENTIPTHPKENQADESSASALEVMEREASIKQIENSVSTQQIKSDSTTSASQEECISNNSVILTTGEDPSQASPHNVAMNNFTSTSQTLTTTTVVAAECPSLTNKLSTTSAPLHLSQTEEESMVTLTLEKQHEEAIEEPELKKNSFCISSGSPVTNQTDKEPASSDSQMREHEILSSDLQQDDS